MDKNIVIKLDRENKLLLTSITDADLDNLRNWKNEFRHVFFHQEFITPEQQRLWFAQYLKDADNHMFIIEYSAEPIGCLGFRLIGSADIYNVILAKTECKRMGIMSSCLGLLYSYICGLNRKEITVKVLRSNTAGVNFYKKNGFSCLKDEGNYLLLHLASQVRPLKGVLVSQG